LQKTGDLNEARAYYERALAIREKAFGSEHKSLRSTLWRLGVISLALGDRVGAEPLFQRALSIKKKNAGSDAPGFVYDQACYSALTGDREGAIHLLRRAVDLGYQSEWIARDPDLDSLHGDPAFEAIVAEVKRRVASK
ncbi:MAG: tetratricopeptide repeat protein, partial [Acidobacteriota bacterium]